MRKIIACPSCRTQIDVGQVQGGAIMHCASCGTKLRIPSSGKTVRFDGRSEAEPAETRTTGQRAAVRTGKRRAAAEDGSGGRSMPQRKSNTGLIVGVIVGCVVAVGLIMFLLFRGEPKSAPSDKKPTETSKVKPEEPAKSPATATPNRPAESEVPKPAVERPAPGVTEKARWEMWLDGLKRYSNVDRDTYGYDEPEPKACFESVKALGKNAYPYLLAYFLDEDPLRAKAACVALMVLSHQKTKLPGFKADENKTLQSEWQKMLGVSDSEMEAAQNIVRH